MEVDAQARMQERGKALQDVRKTLHFWHYDSLISTQMAVATPKTVFHETDLRLTLQRLHECTPTTGHTRS